MRKSLVPLLALILNLVACANVSLGPPPARQDGPLDKVVSAFTGCDAAFFRALNDDQEIWKVYAPLETKGAVTRIKVDDRKLEERNRVDLQDQATVQGIRLLSFFDEISDLGSLGVFHYWGFIAEGNTQQIANQLQVLVRDRARLRRDSSSYVRTEVKGLNTGWFPMALRSGSAPGLGRVERVLLIEPETDNRVRISCSLQGAVNAGLLQVERPDMDVADYPSHLSPTLFADTQVPSAVLAVAKNAATLAPKFRRVSYSYQSAEKRSDKARTTTVRLENNNGVLESREIYGPAFSVDRVSMAGIVQLKSRMNELSDGRVLLTTDLSIASDLKLEPGAIWQIDGKGQKQPSRPGEAVTNMGRRCEVKRGVEAKNIHPNLVGQAYILSCTYGGSDKPSELAFITDLGLAITAPQSLRELKKDEVFSYITFEVER